MAIQKWEYKRVVTNPDVLYENLAHSEVIKEHKLVLDKQGNPVKDKRDMNQYRVVEKMAPNRFEVSQNRLGDEGWELVTYMPPLTQGEMGYLVYKRPKIEKENKNEV